MAISRLQNLGSNPKGVQLYVDPGNFDATDSIENRGNSILAPFATIQRALLEAARYSYLPGENNDVNDKTTIIISSGEHYIDNRPGFSITNNGGALFKKRTGATQWTQSSLTELNQSSNFDLFNPNNDLYKFNSIEGGVIVPRGTSIVCLDPSKTKIRPLFVPNPNNDEIEISSIFKMTGNCYFDSFSILDADLSAGAYNDYTYSLVNPKFSHHKLIAFTFADGINKVKLGNEQTVLTDLQMYYYKVTFAYGSASGRGIEDYPSNIDFQPLLDEYQIGCQVEEKSLGISSIRSGDGAGGGVLSELTVTTKDPTTGLESPHNLNQNKSIIISGITINPESYNGSFVVRTIVGLNTFTCITSSIPTIKLPTAGQISNATVKTEIDTVTSSSPQIYSQIHSVYGMCGLLADGSKIGGLKTVEVPKLSGTSLQKDDNAFLLYSRTSNNYLESNQITQDSVNKPLYTNSSSIYKPAYESYLIKASNNASVKGVASAEGFSKQFIVESGGSISIQSSNSTFGALAFESSGFKNSSLSYDDTGFITHIIPPRNSQPNDSRFEWLQINVGLTTASSNDSNKRLYLQGYNDVNKVPPHRIEEFKVGAKINEELNLGISSTIYKSPILMTVSSGTGVSAVKSYKVQRVANVNSITTDTITLTSNHQLDNGETVRIISDTGELPDGLSNDSIYYVIKTINANQIKLANSFNSATATAPISISGLSSNGGNISILSSVSDKKPSDVGHPIQWDNTVKNWYVNSSTDTTNTIHTFLKTSSETITSRTFITRKIDDRSNEDRLYKIRYVIPKEYTNARPPTPGFILQESKTVGVTTFSVNNNVALSIFDRRNERVINSITAGTISNNSQIVTAKTEVPHRLLVDDTIKVSNVTSTYNPTSTGITSSFNGSFTVLSTPDSRTFTYRITGVSTNPGAFTNNLNTRNSNTVSLLPVVSREKYKNTIKIQNVDTIKNHIPGANGQDGVYYITLLGSNVKTSSKIGYGLSTISYTQNISDLYSQSDSDNYTLNAQSSVSYADHLTIGKSLTNDKRNSLTKESLEYLLQNNQIGFGITNVAISGIGSTTITIQTEVEHKLNSIRSISLTSGGSGHSGSYYGARVTIGSTITDAVCNYDTSAGSIQESSIEFIDFGSSFTAGQTIGIGTLGATATISSINSNISDGLELSGFIQNDLNNVFRIISIPDSKTIVLESSNSISSYIPNANSRTPFGYISAKGVNVSSYNFTNLTTGIVTVTTSSSHGLLEGNNFKIVGSGSSIYNSDFIVNSVGSGTTFTFKVENATQIPASTTGIIYRRTLYPNAKSVGNLEENLGSRLSYIYGGISGIVSSITDTNVVFTDNTGFNRGDYLQINHEVIRLTQKLSNSFNVERGAFGTLKSTISPGTSAFKIKVIPVELRESSVISVLGHKLENVGYGPGNYSTSVSQKQTRRLSKDEIAAATSRQLSGGSVIFDGDYSLNGQRPSADVLGSLTLRQGIIVEGGKTNEDLSVFNGPVKFNKGITSIDNVSSKSASLNTKKFSYNLSETQSKEESLNIGDILYGVTPSNYMGKIKYSSNSWRRWGLISNTENTWDISLDKLTVADLNVTNSLIVNGVAFNTGSVSDLTVNRLTVVGISSLQGNVFGNNGVVGFADSIGVGSGINTSYIRSNGRTIDIGSSSTYSQYGLRITRSSTSANSKTEILHRGTGSFEIKAEDSSGSSFISIGSTSPDNGVVSISRNSSTTGTSGAHLSIINTNTTSSSDAVISWKGGNTGYWFAGMRGSNSTWNLVYATPPIGISNGTFNTPAVGITTTGTLTATGFVGDGIVPIGGIIFWSGTSQQATTLEPSWALCDGRTVNNRTTPDLRGRFIVGVNTSIAIYDQGATGGSKDSVVVDHTHRPNILNNGQRYNYALSGTGLTNPVQTGLLVVESNAAGNGTVSSTAGAVFDPAGNIEIGASATNANLPPYYALAYIMRTK